GAGLTRGALRAQRLHPGGRLGNRLLRPVGSGARQGPGHAHRSRARGRHGSRARPRQLHQRPDSPLPWTATMIARGGIDLGGTKIQTVIFDGRWKVLGEARRPTPTTGGPKGVAEQMSEALREAAEAAG